MKVLIMAFCLYFLLFPKTIYAQDSQQLRLNATVALSPEFTSLFIGNSSITLNRHVFKQNNTLVLKTQFRSSPQSKFINHPIKIDISDSQSTIVYTDSDSRLYYTLPLTNFTPGNYQIIITDLYYQTPISFPPQSFTVLDSPDFIFSSFEDILIHFSYVFSPNQNS